MGVVAAVVVVVVVVVVVGREGWLSELSTPPVSMQDAHAVVAQLRSVAPTQAVVK